MFNSTVKKIPAALLKDLVLIKSSWHHTSNHYNRTDFYSISQSNVERLTDEIIENNMRNHKILTTEQKKKKEIEEVWECEFLEWSGTRKHPKATKIVETGTIKGNWFYRNDGTKKSVNAKGFFMLRKVN